ncbi:MAG: zinc ribbon domain-containing protein [Alkaliphilus sp.]
MSICQSCSMPFQSQESYGKNKDGTINRDYCIYCYPKGEFNNPKETINEMIESCVAHMVKCGHTEKESRELLSINHMRTLKRWR